MHILDLYPPDLNLHIPHFILPLLCFLLSYTLNPQLKFTSDINLHTTVVVKTEYWAWFFVKLTKKTKSNIQQNIQATK
jgi:positive regulator of sigma E activity